MKMFFGTLILSVMAAASVVQAFPFKTIAFPLGGVVVQEIPARNAQTFNAEDIITINDKGRSRNYVIRPGAREVLGRFASDYGYKLVIMTPEPSEIAKAIADKIQLSNGRTLSDVVSVVKAGVRDFNLTLIQKNYSEVLYLRPSSFVFSAKQQVNTFDMGPAYFAFPSYAQYQARGAAKGKDFPKNEDDWTAENYKWLRFVGVFEYVDGTSAADFKSRAQRMIKETAVSDLIRYGKGIVNYAERDAPAVVPRATPIPAQEKLVAAWGTGNGTDADGEWRVVATCSFRNRWDQYVKDASLEECLKVFPTKLQVAKTRNNDVVCLRLNQDDVLVRVERNLNSCVADPNFQGKYLWTISGEKSCDLYSEKNEMIQPADPSKCRASNKAIIVDNGLGGLGVYVFTLTAEMAGQSPATIVQLLSKDGPTASQPYRLWNPTQQPEMGGLDLKECDTGRQSMKEDGSGNLLPQCQPDTLYTWSPQVKLDWFKRLMPNDGTPWPQNLPRGIFNARSPVATFGYGEIGIRIKLKKGVHFVNSRTYHTCYPSDDTNTVFYRADGSFSDWVICSANVIASWSYDTKEQYDEMIRDRDRVLKVKSGQLDIVNYDFYQGRYRSAVTTMFDRLDGHDFSEEVFAKRFTDALADINAGGGGIYYNPSLSDGEKTRASHFATDHPIYFNQQ